MISNNMAILLANLGTSDLAIKINDFDYCLPIFERKEPNEDTSKLTTYELDAWNDRDTYTKFLYDELDIRLIKSKNTGEQTGEVDSSFIEFSNKLLKAYLSDPNTWHHRIRPGRIGGVILDAQKKFDLQEIHLFVTNQNPQHKLDTIYLFEILKFWFKREYNLILTAQEIPFGVTAREADKLLDFYYQFFTEHISNDSTLLVSIKGGTPQMQTALKIQAIASSVARLMFIDPQFDIAKTLAGKFSECQLTSYWRYMRTQKYQIVKLLLEENHWDFNGSIQILKDWQLVLKFFINHQVVETNDIANSSEAISRMIKTLDIGINSFNLDISSAKNFLDSNSQLKLSKSLINQVSNYDIVLNLYTQCRIYWKLNQVANFLSRMSSFYEAILVKIAHNMGFYSNFPLKDNRFNKRSFVDSHINLNSTIQEKQAWQEILSLLKSIDFWCEQRNEIIHLAKGVSKQKMEELFNQQRQYNSDICAPQSIMSNMTKILSNDLEIVRKEYKNKFVGDNQEYYIYSEVKNWVIETLDSN
jgi:hypothetical protein